MDILPHKDEPFCYDVPSESHPTYPHRVDLLALGGIGQCSCETWKFRAWPKIKGGGRAYCRHVTAARNYLIDQILEDQSKKHDRS